MGAQRARGFTLVELLITVAIIAVLLVIALPSYQSITVQDRMASEINDLNGDLEFARSAAIKQGVPATICASDNPQAATPGCGANWSSGWIVFTDIGNNQTYAPASGDALLRVHAGLSGGDALTGLQGSTGAFSGSLAAITFNRMGGTANFGALSLHDAKNTLAWRRCLVVSLVGTAQLNTEAKNPGVCP